MAERELNRKVILRKDAKRLFLKFYWTGSPCCRGHLSKRRTTTGKCQECAKIIQKNFCDNHPGNNARNVKAWRLKNPLYNKQYFENNGIAINLQRRKRYSTNPEKHKKEVRDWNLKNAQKHRDAARKWRMLNPERQKRNNKEWRTNNPERAACLGRKYRAKKKGNGGSHTAADIRDIFKMQRGKCAYCRISIDKKYDVDHIIPIVKNGSDNRSNLQLLCPPCNRSKNSKDSIDFMRSLGRLL